MRSPILCWVRVVKLGPQKNKRRICSCHHQPPTPWVYSVLCLTNAIESNQSGVYSQATSRLGLFSRALRHIRFSCRPRGLCPDCRTAIPFVARNARAFFPACTPCSQPRSHPSTYHAEVTPPHCPIRLTAALLRILPSCLHRPSDPSVSVVSTANLAALGGYKDPQEALKRYACTVLTRCSAGRSQREVGCALATPLTLLGTKNFWGLKKEQMKRA